MADEAKTGAPAAPGGLWRDRVVAVLIGGPSAERAVSQQTGAAIVEGLRRAGHRHLEIIDPGADLPEALRACKAEVVYNALHGTLAEDGRLPGLLDWMGIPYTGESAAVAALTFDKALTRQVVAAAGVPVAEARVYLAEQAMNLQPEDLDLALPVMVKPCAEGSSVGVSLVRTAEALVPALRAAAAHGAVLVETFVKGPEVSVGLLGHRALGTVEIEPAREFYDYEAKYGENSGTRYHLPPRLSAEAAAAVHVEAEKAARALGCRAGTRADFIVSPGGPIFIEINTLPGMTRSSLLPKIAAAAGIPFDQLVTHILDAARTGFAWPAVAPVR